jgi:GWxTD domain-containing protein
MKRVERLLGRRARRDSAVMPAIAAVLTLAVAAGMALEARPATPRPQIHPSAVATTTEVTQPAAIKEAPKKLLAQARPADKPAVAAADTPLPAVYKTWIDDDVVYIISDEEKRAFRELKTDEERDHFVEQFWLRRDPTPGTSENEFKAEIYRRIAYANEHFTGSIPGWKTDRGRIYIQYGPPDEIESHPSGGHYVRPASEGGGETQTYPFEQWRYKWMDGKGPNIIIEFVDTTMKGDYRMTMDPKEKDALLKQN